MLSAIPNFTLYICEREGNEPVGGNPKERGPRRGVGRAPVAGFKYLQFKFTQNSWLWLHSASIFHCHRELAHCLYKEFPVNDLPITSTLLGFKIQNMKTGKRSISFKLGALVTMSCFTYTGWLFD